MPGLCGFVCEPGSAQAAELFSSMLNRMRHHNWYRKEQHSDQSAGLALGRVSLGFIQTSPQPVWDSDRRTCCILQGELYGTSGAIEKLAKVGVHLDSNASHAEIVLHGFLQQGRKFFRDLNGAFVAVIWDGVAKRLTIVNDRFGMKQFYYAHYGRKFAFASEIKSLLADSELPRERSSRGLAQFFAFGHFVANDTLLSSVHALPAAAWITYEQASNRVQIDQYWSLSEIQYDPKLTEADFLDRFTAAFRRAVQFQTEGDAQLGISLSGGLDSRCILAAIDHQHVPLTSVSMGVAGGLDHRCAQQMADLTNRNHHRAVLDSQFLKQFPQHMRHMVHLTDGHYLDQCIVIPTLPKYRELGIQVLLRGHAGELMHMNKAYNFSLDAEGWAIRDEPSLQKWLKRHMSCYMLESLHEQLFSGITTDELNSLKAESLDEVLKHSTGVEPQLHRVWHLFITERLRRETAMSMAKIGTMFETRLPFLDNEVIDLLLRIPPEWKRDDRIQSHLLKQLRPEFVSIINANTGVRLGAPKWQRKVAGLRYKVLAKLGLPGYQPYERLGLWLRRELRPWVQEVLLADRTLERGIFETQTVRSVVAEHFDRRANHTALLLALLIFEFGQREFIDGEAFEIENESNQSDARLASKMAGSATG